MDTYKPLEESTDRLGICNFLEETQIDHGWYYLLSWRCLKFLALHTISDVYSPTASVSWNESGITPAENAINRPPRSSARTLETIYRSNLSERYRASIFLALRLTCTFRRPLIYIRVICTAEKGMVCKQAAVLWWTSSIPKYFSRWILISVFIVFMSRSRRIVSFGTEHGTLDSNQLWCIRKE